MKITSFNPLIVTKDADSAIALFEELGFVKRHTKDDISLNNVTDVRMKDANGFHVDVSQGRLNGVSAAFLMPIVTNWHRLSGNVKSICGIV